MDLQQLVYFSKVAEFQNISKAAEVLYVTQPALTRAIKKLEEELDCPLFQRRGKALVLTENGKLLQQRAQELMQMMRNVKNEVGALNSNKRQIVTVQLRCIFGLFMDVLGRFMKENPDIEFRVLQDDDSGINFGDYDLLLFPTSNPVQSRSSEILLKEEVFIAMSDADPLAQKAELKVEDLQGHPYVSIGEKRMFYQTTSTHRKQLRFPVEITAYCDGMTAVRNLVRDWGYVSQMPQYTWSKTDLSGITLRPLSDARLYRYVCMTWNGDTHMNQATKQFKNYLYQYLAERELLYRHKL